MGVCDQGRATGSEAVRSFGFNNKGASSEGREAGASGSGTGINCWSAAGDAVALFCKPAEFAPGRSSDASSGATLRVVAPGANSLGSKLGG
jgi:hypothetical protein